MQIVVSGKSKLKLKKALFDKKGVFIFEESSYIVDKKYRFIFLYRRKDHIGISKQNYMTMTEKIASSGKKPRITELM